MKHIRRGYSEDDRKYFGGEALVILSSCARDIVYLLDRGYPYKTVISFVKHCKIEMYFVVINSFIIIL